MPLTWRELSTSRRANVGANGGSLTREWVAYRTLIEADVYVEALVQADPYFDGFIRQDIALEPLGGGVWKVTVTYGTVGLSGGDQPAGPTGPDGIGGGSGSQPTAPAGTDPLGPGYSFETTGGTVHITQSIETTGSGCIPALPGAPDTKKAIGQTKDSVEGCDIIAPKMEWSRQVHRPVCTIEYLKDLRDLTGRVNADPFYQMPAETVLYLGASGTFQLGQGWSITHRFAYAPHELAVNIGNGLIVPIKRGHEYLWVMYDDEEAVVPRLLQTPAAWYTERVYRLGDFSFLEID